MMSRGNNEREVRVIGKGEGSRGMKEEGYERGQGKLEREKDLKKPNMKTTKKGNVIRG